MSGAGSGAGTVPAPGTDQSSVAEWVAWNIRDNARWVAELGGWAFRADHTGWRWQTGAAADARVHDEISTLVLAHAATVGGRAGAAMRSARWIEAIERMTWRRYAWMHRALPDWDTEAFALQTPDGVYDLCYGKLRPTGLKDFNLKCTLVTPAAGPCPRMDRFLRESFRGNQKLIDFVEAFYGVAMRGNHEMQQTLMLIGEARSGKSTLVDLMRRVAGDYATKLSDGVFVETNGYANARDYAMAKLPGCRIATTSEIRKGTVFDDAAFKTMNGGDRQFARHPRGTPFDFSPVFTPIMAMNDRPVFKTGVDQEAIQRRLAIVPMNNAVAVVDPELPEALMTEAPQWLARCLAAGVFQYLNGPALVTPQEVTDSGRSAVEGLDPVSTWWAECGLITNNPLDIVWVDAITPQIRAWIRDGGHLPLQAPDNAVQFKFRQMLDRQTNGVLGRSSKVQRGSERKQAFTGIQLVKTFAVNGAFDAL